jgi:hypothetical protein
VDPLVLGIAAVGFGDLDDAFSHLIAAVGGRSTNALQVGVDPVYDPLRSDLRYSHLISLLPRQGNRAVMGP